MATLWETDSIAISPLATAQYPAINGTWDYIVPHTSISSDGDIHTDMAVDSSGTGSNSNNYGESPIVCEVINATSNQLNHLDGLTDQHATFRGIFRFYTEHSGERHFELHPVTQLQRWNGSSFVTDIDYRSNITDVSDGASHATSTLTNLLNGTQTITATISADNNSVTLSCPSPSVNYVQYDGVALSGVLTDSVSQYFLFQPNLVPEATVRCRLVTNTGAATMAAGLAPDQALTVNALTRTDMAAVNTEVSGMTANQQKTFARPVEFITLDLPNVGPAPTATPTATTFVNGGSIAIRGGRGAEVAASPYPSTIAIAGLPGVISKVTVGLNGLNTVYPMFPEDIDVLLVGPSAKNTLLMSDAGGDGQLTSVNLVFDDAAASPLSDTQITSGTYQPTDYDSGDKDAFPSPAPSKPFGTALSDFNGISPNGNWNLFVLDEYISGTGSIANGWSVMIRTVPAPPVVITKAATNIKSSSATLNGTINPLGDNSSYSFQFGLDTTYGFVQDVQSAGSGTDPVNVSVALSGLKPGTTYHYRLTGANNAGVTTANDVVFTASSFADSDGDGLPNDYENAVGLNPNDPMDAALDTDGDGMTNLQEYQAGTDPKSASSVLRITSVQISGGDVVVTFPSNLGETYRLEQRNSINAAWSVVSDNIHGTGSPISVPDVEAADQNSSRFYRVGVVP